MTLEATQSTISERIIGFGVFWTVAGNCWLQGDVHLTCESAEKELSNFAEEDRGAMNVYPVMTTYSVDAANLLVKGVDLDAAKKLASEVQMTSVDASSMLSDMTSEIVRLRLFADSIARLHRWEMSEDDGVCECDAPEDGHHDSHDALMGLIAQARNLPHA